VPLAQGQAEDLSVFVSTGTHVVVDVMGYFKPPGAPIGTVSNIATGTGLTGGPITTTGTIGLAATQLLPPVACASNQVPQWNGSAWACATTNTRTVMSVATGTGLTGGPITSTGTINLAATNLLPTAACAANQIPKWNGSAWACGNDNNSGGTVTSITAGAGLTGGTITTSGTIAVDPTSSTLAGNFFRQYGNSFGTSALLGTNDNNALALEVNGLPSLVIHYATDGTNESPNIIGGSFINSVSASVVGATIAGGGDHQLGNPPPPPLPNQVTADFGTVGGGSGNTASFYSVVAGGRRNTASGNGSIVAGGDQNTASGIASTVAGGVQNTAAGDYSFAAGWKATIPASAPGSFLWSDSTGPVTLPDGAHDQFIAVATNGIGFYTYKDFTHGCFIVGFAASWTCTSDRATKSDFTAIDPREVLARLVGMPIAQWRFKGEAETVRHLGPTAQDFRAAFGLGYNDKTIALVDTEGVALAAIHGLHQLLQEKEREIARLEAKAAKVDMLERELNAIKVKLGM
jgi:hypothetical protein